jgi:predicted O-methyltransferase YrrM
MASPTHSDSRPTAAPGSTGHPIHWRQQLFLFRRGVVAFPFARQIPIATPEEAFPGLGRITVEMTYQYEPRGLPHGVAYILSCVTAYVQPRRIFEIGTGRGGGTLLMASQAPEAQIDTLDLGENTSTLGVGHADAPLETTRVGDLYLDSEHRERITQHLGDSATFDFTPFYGQMDLVLVDGAHTYTYAKHDSQTALAMVRPGGVILWDDCHLYHPGVSRALAELRREGHPVARIDNTRLAYLRIPPDPAHA